MKCSLCNSDLILDPDYSPNPTFVWKERTGIMSFLLGRFKSVKVTRLTDKKSHGALMVNNEVIALEKEKGDLSWQLVKYLESK